MRPNWHNAAIEYQHAMQVVRMTHDTRASVSRRQFDDAIVWEIVCQPETPPRVLAHTLGILPQRVRSIRHRVRNGWTVAVSYRPCMVCGQMMTIGGHVRRDRTYHRDCRAQALRDMGRRHDTDRFARMDPERLAARRSFGLQHERRVNTETQARAAHHGARWTREEDAALLAHGTGNDRDLAVTLGRSLYAVRHRTNVLKRNRPKYGALAQGATETNESLNLDYC